VRLIFEEEDPNAYAEPALTVQCFVAAFLGQCGSPACRSGRAERTNLVLKRCEKVLAMLHSRIRRSQDRIVHDVTRDARVMTELHSLILGSAALLYAGVGGSESSASDWHSNAISTVAPSVRSMYNLQELASSLLVVSNSVASSCPFGTLHPPIRRVVQTLASGRPRGDATRDEIACACFLMTPQLVHKKSTSFATIAEQLKEHTPTS